MRIDERSRRELHASLVSIHGPEVADTLMTYLPPVEFGQLATKEDLVALEGRLGARIVTVAGELRGEMGELRGEMGEFRGEVRGEIAEVRGEIAELRGELREMRGELRGEISKQGEVFARAQARQTQLFIAWNGSFFLALTALVFGDRLLG